MRKLVVGCGYLGQRVAAKWAEAGDEVFALTRSEERAAAFRDRGWQPIVADVMHPETLKTLPEVEVLLYAVGFDRSSGLSQRAIYVEGLTNVLDAVADRVGRLLYVSSTSVYGQNQGEWIDETSPCEPTKENGRICREAEQVVERFPNHHNIFRLAGIYGPGRLLRRLADLKAGQPISGDPEGWLNLIHVDDAGQVLLAAEHRAKSGAVYLVSDNQPIRRREYYAQLAQLAGVDLPPFDAGSQPRHADGLGKRCSNRKIREDLGVELLYPSIEQGLPHAVAGDLESR